ncbi:Uncharacterised protein [Mycobacteroides abscessus subsp. abscessus]|nr:Uncharacterised protein [Mycobacteroides abscessus subsp. abscessus]
MTSSGVELRTSPFTIVLSTLVLPCSTSENTMKCGCTPKSRMTGASSSSPTPIATWLGANVIDDAANNSSTRSRVISVPSLRTGIACRSAP